MLQIWEKTTMLLETAKKCVGYNPSENIWNFENSVHRTEHLIKQNRMPIMLRGINTSFLALVAQLIDIGRMSSRQNFNLKYVHEWWSDESESIRISIPYLSGMPLYRVCLIRVRTNKSSAVSLPLLSAVSLFVLKALSIALSLYLSLNWCQGIGTIIEKSTWEWHLHFVCELEEEEWDIEYFTLQQRLRHLICNRCDIDADDNLGRKPAVLR